MHMLKVMINLSPFYLPLFLEGKELFHSYCLQKISLCLDPQRVV
jgi:hypothetical protein